MMFSLTILGCNGPYPKAGGACSSYLLEAGQNKILIDAGSGSLSNLMKLTTPEKLGCIILSHLHWDHITDIPVIFYNLLIKDKRGDFKGKIDLYMPGSPSGIADIIKGFEYFNVHIVDEKTTFMMDGCSFSFCRMTHPVESYAIKAAYEGKTFVYSGDTTKNDRLAAFAAGCNLLLADSAFLRKQLSENSPHMSAAQCAEIAREAGAELLALTHQSPETDVQLYEKEAKEIYPAVHIVRLMERMEI